MHVARRCETSTLVLQSIKVQSLRIREKVVGRCAAYLTSIGRATWDKTAAQTLIAHADAERHGVKTSNSKVIQNGSAADRSAPPQEVADTTHLCKASDELSPACDEPSELLEFADGNLKSLNVPSPPPATWTRVKGTLSLLTHQLG